MIKDRANEQESQGEKERRNRNMQQNFKSSRDLYYLGYNIFNYVCNHCFIHWLLDCNFFRKHNFITTNNPTNNKNNDFCRTNLERISNNSSSPPILSSFETICRTNGRIVSSGSIENEKGKRERSTSSIRKERKERINEKGVTMSINKPVFTLEQDMYVYIELNVSGRRPKIEYTIESEYGITVYLLDEEEFDNFKNDEDYSPHRQHLQRKHIYENINLPYTGTWYCVIWNRGDIPTAVYYEIYTT